MGRKSKNQFNNQLEDRPAGNSTTNLKVDAGTISETKATATTGERPTSCGDGDDGTLIDGVAHCDNSDSVWVGHNLLVLARARERERRLEWGDNPNLYVYRLWEISRSPWIIYLLCNRQQSWHSNPSEMNLMPLSLLFVSRLHLSFANNSI